MMFALKVENVMKEWNGKRLFENVSLEVTVGERVALIGKNGVGKTSLIEGLMGRNDFDAGQVGRMIPLEEWGLVEQDLCVEEGLSLLDFVRGARKELLQLKRQMDETLLGIERDPHEITLVERYTKWLEAYAARGGYEFEIEVEQALKRLGLDATHWEIPYQNLSGGQKTRAQLAKLSVNEPRFLLLDEPTNHLDAETLIWLESWLKAYGGTVLFVSHDRAFIDAVANTTYELTPKGTKRYSGGYSDYRMARDVEIKTQKTLYAKQERERKALVEAIQQYKQWYEKAHSAASERNPFAKKRAQKNSTRFKAKERALERLEAQGVERPHDGFHVDVTFENSAFDAKTLVRFEGVHFSYPNHALFHDIHMDVCRGERIGVVGPNGAGKSTFLRLAMGALLPSSQGGRVVYHPQTRIGYFAQELAGLDLTQTVLDTVLALPGMTQTYARTVLASFLFRDEDVLKRVGDLSMGERCRVAFVNLYFSNANLLVLDEPTNYLDIETRERIEEALCQYPGALLIVSHDRTLLRKLVNRVVYFEETQVKTFSGSFDTFIDRSHREPCEVDVANEIQKLELALTQYMSAETSSTDDHNQLMQAIRHTRSRLNALRSNASLRDFPLRHEY